MRNLEKKRYAHNCRYSIYLGHYNEYDLYFNEKSLTLIARNSNKSFIHGNIKQISDLSYPLYITMGRVLKYGLLKEDLVY